MSRLVRRLLQAILFWAATSSLAVAAPDQPHLDDLRFAGRALEGNPLHDPVTRRLAVFVPAQYTNGIRLPVVYFLPGYGGSSEGFIRRPKPWLDLTRKIAEDVTPMLLVVPDCRTRWGGSQYLNSPAQGNYADYVCEDIVSLVQSRYSTATNGIRRIIAGHSSGGFGALRLGMAHHQLFDGVIALSPDSDFPVSHLPLVKLPGVTNATLAQVRLIEAEKVPAPGNGDLLYALGLSAAYAPLGPLHPGQFEWLYNAHGHLRPAVWRRWLDNDPLTIARRKPHAFAADQAVYLDGAAQDQFSANIGARKIYEAIRSRLRRCAFYEPPGRHGQHVPARLQRGLEWIFGRPVRDIKGLRPGG
ncbi:MAG: alpha/beta fold hydrolase [Verrucomicrobiota bacterium]|nr:alpha/beta fold hydrolase [Verrucomicrobiota bacterium]